MLPLDGLFRLLKKIIVVILIVGILIPLRYGSTNRQYLQLRLLHSILSLKHTLVSDNDRPTLSADYRAFENMVRMRPIEERDPLADPISVAKDIRSTFTLGTIIPKPSQCQVKKEIFEHDGHTVDAYWVDYSVKKFEKNSDILLLYLHGGGYIIGDIYGYSGFECHLSRLFNVTILHLEYRLSPEHPLLSAVDDTVAIYHALIRHNILPSQLLIMGDSAGGGLSLLTIQALNSRQLPVPRGIILISPWVDLSTSSDSYIHNDETDVVLNTHDAKWAASQLLDPNQSQISLDHPLVSPLFGSFEGFPPMYVTVGTAEILEDEVRLMANKAIDAGVNVIFEEGLHLLHAYPIFFPYYPEAQNALNNINKWIQTLPAQNTEQIN